MRGEKRSSLSSNSILLVCVLVAVSVLQLCWSQGLTHSSWEDLSRDRNIAAPAGAAQKKSTGSKGLMMQGYRVECPQIKRSRTKRLADSSFRLLPCACTTKTGWSSETSVTYKYQGQILVFVHIFKTGGSSLRVIFEELATALGCGSATVVSCSILNSMREESQCVATRLTTRDDQDSIKKGFGGVGIRDTNSNSKMKVSKVLKKQRDTEKYAEGHGVYENRDLFQKSVSIIAGHMKYGIHEDIYWDFGIRTEAAYITFLRDPLSLFVSAILYMDRMKASGERENFEINPDKFMMKAEDLIERAWEVESSGQCADTQYFHNFARFLLSSNQIVNLEANEDTGCNMASEQALQEMKSNLDNFVLVGIVERWEESIDLLQRITDPSGYLKENFEKIRHTKINVSKGGKDVVSTSVGVSMLTKSRPDLISKFEEITKTEVEVYKHGLALFEKKMMDLDGIR